MSKVRDVFGNTVERLADKYGACLGYVLVVAWWFCFSLSMSLPIAFALWLLGVPLDYSSFKTYGGLAILWFLFSGR